MNHSTKQVAVIGAGPSGLAAAKALKDYGCSPTIFEGSDSVGGLWNAARGPTWEGMRTNISKHSCRFSELDHLPTVKDFATVPEMQAYLNRYAVHSKISDHIRLQSPVSLVRPRDDLRWEVSGNLPSGGSYCETFDGVVIASGFFSRGPIPQIRNLERFSGEKLHSSQYRSHTRFAGKHVVVVGQGLSGVEIAADLCLSAASVTHLFRRPGWVIPRYIPTANGKSIPLDLSFYRRKQPSNGPALSREEAIQRRNTYFDSITPQNKLGLPALEINPKSTQAHPVAISDSYLQLSAQQAIRLVPHQEIIDIEERLLKLDDGASIHADVIIFATGYRFALPFLDEQVKSEIEFAPDDPLQPTILSHACLPARRTNLGFVGTYKGPFFGAMELQARLVAATIADESGAFHQSQTSAERIKIERNVRNETPSPPISSFRLRLAV